MLEHKQLDDILTVIEPLLTDSDRFKQRAGTELLAGLLRGMGALFITTLVDRNLPGSKHWPRNAHDRLWQWTISRLGTIYNQIKPDTLSFWEGLFNVSAFFTWFTVTDTFGF